MPVLVGILKQFLCLLFLLREGWGCQIQSVINEHFKRLIVAAKMFKFISCSDKEFPFSKGTLLPTHNLVFIVEIGETLDLKKQNKKLYHS